MNWTRVCPLDELRRRGVVTVTVNGLPIAVFIEKDAVYAIDNRCPHMGFPMSKGTLKNGIVTCHWHAWQFDASCGGCFTEGGSHLDAFPTEVRDGEVRVRVETPDRGAAVERWTGELKRGLERLSTLRLAKSSHTLLSHDVPIRDIIAQGVWYGTHYRETFGTGLVMLAAMANLVRDVKLEAEERVLALSHGLRAVARDIQATPVRRIKGGLTGTRAEPGRLREWLRGFIFDREVEAAQRTLMTIIESDARPEEALYTAVTDFLFLGTGHMLDFANKAAELMDHVGRDAAVDLLPGLIEPICDSQRHEEDMSWKQPHDLVSITREAEKELVKASTEPRGWKQTEALAEVMLGEDAAAIGKGLIEAVRAGATPTDLTRTLCLAATLRLGRFHVRNEFLDWDTVHHAVTHINALHQAVRRVHEPLLWRGIAHAAMYLYLARFLNIPKYRLPHENGSASKETDIALQIEQRRVDSVAGSVYAYIQSRHEQGPLESTLVRASIVEDHGFHTLQQTEAAVAIARELRDSALGYVPLAGLARYLAAHSPTPRSVRQTVENAIKLQKGVALYE